MRRGSRGNLSRSNSSPRTGCTLTAWISRPWSPHSMCGISPCQSALVWRPSQGTQVLRILIVSLIQNLFYFQCNRRHLTHEEFRFQFFVSICCSPDFLSGEVAVCDVMPPVNVVPQVIMGTIVKEEGFDFGYGQCWALEAAVKKDCRKSTETQALTGKAPFTLMNRRFLPPPLSRAWLFPLVQIVKGS